MMEIRQEVLAFLNREPLLRVAPLEAIRRKVADVTASTKGGVLVYNRESDLYMLCADDRDAVRALLLSLPKVSILVSDCAEADGLVMEHLGFDTRQLCNNVVYLKKEAPETESRLEIRPLTEEDAELVSSHYEIYGLEQITETIRLGHIMGGYRGQELVGFFGWHDEGSMGLLHVFEPYRNKGYAYELEARQIALTMKKGLLPYGQVIVGNTASMALQKKLGFTVEEKTVSWMFKAETAI